MRRMSWGRMGKSMCLVGKEFRGPGTSLVLPPWRPHPWVSGEAGTTLSGQ